MTKKLTTVFLSLLLIFAVSFILFKNNSFSQKSGGLKEISVIFREQNGEDLATIKSGMNQAADDLNVEVNFCSPSGGMDASQQASVLEQESKSGTDAIIIMPADSSVLSEQLCDLSEKIPVVAMQSDMRGISGVKNVSCDNGELGRALGQKIIEKEKSYTDVMILKNASNSMDGSEIYSGIEKIFQGKEQRIESAEIPDDPEEAYEQTKEILANQKGESCVIALDSQTLEAAGKAKRDLTEKGLQVQTHLYGVGRTNTIMSLLEDNVISAVGVKNEYNIGYCSISLAVDSINHRRTEDVCVNFIISDRLDMYKSENAYLLFPFIR